MKKQSGFTLIELMVVMAIIAVLATAGISAYTDYIKKARDTTRLSIASQIETAVNALMGANNGTPPDSEELITYLGTLNMTAAMDALNGEEPRLLSSVGNMVRDFVGGSPLYAFIREPSGGRAICLGYNGTDVVGGQSCAFQYIVYGDNTYVIGYGIETETNMKVNFYKVATGAGGTNPQYMQVKGTAQYVGTPSIGEDGGPGETADAFMVSKVVINTTNGTVDNTTNSASGIDDTRSAPLSDGTTGGGGGLGVGETCAVNGDCISGTCNSNWLQCTTGENDAPCNDDTECRDGYTCGMGGYCTDGSPGSICPQGGICTGGSYCDGDRCIALKANGEACTASGDCVGSCVNNLDWDPNFLHCTDGGSNNPCGSNSDCTQAGELCTYACYYDSGGKCCTLPRPDNDQPCMLHEECQSNFCPSSTCLSGDVGGYCEDNSYCPLTGYCDVNTHQCATP